MRARLYLDADVTPELARMLRALSEDVISAHEIGALELDDEDQLARATADGRAILTFNYRDFVMLDERWRASARTHAGIIISYRQYGREELGAARRAVRALLEAVTAEALYDAVLALDSFRQA